MRRAPLTFILSCALMLISHAACAQQMPQQQPEMPEPEGKADTWYLGLTATNFHHRSIGQLNRTANTQAAGLKFGRFMTDYIKMELRGGWGVEKDKPRPDLEIGIDHYASAYIGVLYPWSMFSRVYAQFGVSWVEAETRGATGEDEFSDIPEEYFEGNFGDSFLFGVDFDFIGNSHIFLEAGRLHSDTVTEIQLWQYNTGLRFDF